MKDFWTKKRALGLPHPHTLHQWHDKLHIAYFAGVGIEGHGVYSMIALVLFACSLLAVFVHEEVA